MTFEDYCIYMAGFDRLGRHLYGSWWTGNEHNAHPVEPPGSITNDKRKISERIEELLAEFNDIRNKRRSLLSARQVADLDEQERVASDEHKQLNQRLFELPHNLDKHTQDYDEYMRRLTTTEYLRQALENDAVIGWFGIPPIGMRWSEWGNRDGYVLYPELSMIRTPNHGRGRRMTVFFQLSAFDEWLDTIKPLNPEARPGLTTEDLYRSYIQEFYEALNGRLPKLRFEEYVRSKVEKFHPRIFNDAWAHEESIPARWKEAGNIPKSERHRD